MPPVRLKPAALRSRVQHSTTEPLRSAINMRDIMHIASSVVKFMLPEILSKENCLNFNKKENVMFSYYFATSSRSNCIACFTCTVAVRFELKIHNNVINLRVSIERFRLFLVISSSHEITTNRTIL